MRFVVTVALVALGAVILSSMSWGEDEGTAIDVYGIADGTYVEGTAYAVSRSIPRRELGRILLANEAPAYSSVQPAPSCMTPGIHDPGLCRNPSCSHVSDCTSSHCRSCLFMALYAKRGTCF